MKQLGVVACVVASVTVHAQPQSYGALFNAGRDELARSAFPEARALFLRAHAIRPNAGSWAALGQVSFELREYARAIGEINQALTSSVRPLSIAQRSQMQALRQRATAYVRNVVVRTPPDAQVLLDGEPTASEFALNVGGRHTIEVQAEAHRSWRRSFVVESGSDAFELVAELEPLVGRFDLMTPRNASIRVDGEPSTNQVVLAPGAHEIEVSLAGHETWTRTMDVRGSEQERIVVTLRPEARSTIESPGVAPDTNVSRAPAVAVTALAGVGVVGTVVGGLWLRDRNDAREQCAGTAACLNADQLDRSRNASLGVTLASVGLAAVSGAVAALIWRKISAHQRNP